MSVYLNKVEDTSEYVVYQVVVNSWGPEEYTNEKGKTYLKEHTHVGYYLLSKINGGFYFDTQRSDRYLINRTSAQAKACTVLRRIWWSKEPFPDKTGFMSCGD